MSDPRATRRQQSASPGTVRAAAADPAGRPRHRRDPRCTSTPTRPSLDERQVRRRPQPRRRRSSTRSRSGSDRRAARAESTPTRSSRARRTALAGTARRSRSAPTSTRSPRATGGAGPTSATYASPSRLSGAGATVTVYRSLANGRAQRVDQRVERVVRAASTPFDLPLKPFVDGGWYWFDVVAADDDAVVESAEWTAEVPGRPGRARHGRPSASRPSTGPTTARAAQPARRRRRRSRPYLDEVLVVDQGTRQGRRPRVLRRGREGARRPAADHRAGQPRRLRRVRPRAVEAVKARPRDYVLMLDDDVESASPRASSARSRSATCAAGPRSSAATCSASTPETAAAQLRRDGRSRGGSGGAPLDGYRRLGPRARATCARPAGCTAGSTSTTTAGGCA